MQEGVQHEEPDHIVHFPEGRWRCAHAGEGRGRGVAYGKWNGGVLFVFDGRSDASNGGGCGGDGEEIASWKAEPGFMDTGEAAESVVLFHNTKLEEII